VNTRNIIALSFLIVALSIGYYFVIYLPQKDNDQKAVQEQTQREQVKSQLDQKNKIQQQQTNLQNCLGAAQRDFDNNFVINSYPAPRPSYPDTRIWTSLEIQNIVNGKLNDNKALCIKEFPQN